jgi:hypothetical protein
MKRLNITTLTLLTFILTPVSASVDLCDRLAGLWVMTQMNPVHPQSSSPVGVINARNYFDAASSKLYTSLPDAEELPNTDKEKEVSGAVSYECEQGVLSLDLPQSKSYAPTTTVTTIKAINEDQLIVSIETHSEFFGTNVTEQIYTKDFFQSKGERFEPVSIQVLMNDENDLNVLDVEYDQKDYSDLSLNERMIGVWEVNRYQNVERQDMPPYGFLNDIYTIKQDEICLLVRYRPEESICMPYKLRGQSMSRPMGENDYVEQVSFNEWGHLEFSNGLITQSLKLISKDISKHPEMPLKVVLTSLAIN